MRLVAGVGLIAAALVGIAMSNRTSSATEPAPPAVLERIAEKNDDAAAEAAASMKAKSEATAAAADARQRAEDEGVDVRPSA